MCFKRLTGSPFITLPANCNPMKERILHLLRYNEWANGQFISVLAALSDEEVNREIVSSFPSIRKTVIHMWSAEDIWLQRLQRVDKPVWNGLLFEGAFTQAMNNWKVASAALRDFVQALPDDSALLESIHVVNIKGEHHDDVIADVLEHVVNHSTFHRGQLVTMIRQVGITTLPSTDLISYTRAGKSYIFSSDMKQQY